MTDSSNSRQVTASQAPNTSDGVAQRHLVAVPDPASSEKLKTDLFRLGQTGSDLTLGETFNNQAFPWAYFRTGSHTIFEIDLLANQLTVSSINPASGDPQTVTYAIDGDVMRGTRLREGEPVEVVFHFDGQHYFDVTGPATDLVITTGPRYGADLAERLGTVKPILRDLHSRIQASEGRHKVATRPPRTARSTAEHTVDLAEHATAMPIVPEPVVIDLREPEPVRVPDPATGEYVGRRWTASEHSTSLNELRSAGYRASFVKFTNGEFAMIVLNHPSGSPVADVTTPNGNRIFQLRDWDCRLTPGSAFTNVIDKSLDGGRDRAGQGFPPSFVVNHVVAIGDHIDRRNPAAYAVDQTAVEFRQIRTERRQEARQRRHTPAAPAAPVHETPVQQPQRSRQAFDLTA
jgi:hypothetical protein